MLQANSMLFCTALKSFLSMQPDCVECAKAKNLTHTKKIQNRRICALSARLMMNCAQDTPIFCLFVRRPRTFSGFFCRLMLSHDWGCGCFYVVSRTYFRLFSSSLTFYCTISVHSLRKMPVHCIDSRSAAAQSDFISFFGPLWYTHVTVKETTAETKWKEQKIMFDWLFGIFG